MYVCMYSMYVCLYHYYTYTKSSLLSSDEENLLLQSDSTLVYIYTCI